MLQLLANSTVVVLGDSLAINFFCAMSAMLQDGCVLGTGGPCRVTSARMVPAPSANDGRVVRWLMQTAQWGMPHHTTWVVPVAGSLR